MQRKAGRGGDEENEAAPAVGLMASQGFEQSLIRAMQAKDKPTEVADIDMETELCELGLMAFFPSITWPPHGPVSSRCPVLGTRWHTVHLVHTGARIEDQT